MRFPPDYNFVPTHSKELEEIQRKRKEFEAQMERQRKIREIKAGIRQNIHVDHNEEDLVGDYRMSVTDDGKPNNNLSSTSYKNKLPA